MYEQSRVADVLYYCPPQSPPLFFFAPCDFSSIITPRLALSWLASPTQGTVLRSCHPK